MGNDTMPYHCGAVQHEPNIHLIFWGPSWQSNGGEIQSELTRSIFSLKDSEWLRAVQAYRDADGAAAQQLKFGGAWYDPSPPPTLFPGGDLAAISAEIKKAVAANGWSTDHDDQFMILPEPGSRLLYPNQWRAYHAYTWLSPTTKVTYSLFDPSTLLDGNNPSAKLFSSPFAHELAETATDPFLDGYNNGTKDEVSDYCDIKSGAVEKESVYSWTTDKCVAPPDIPLLAYTTSTAVVTPMKQEGTLVAADLRITINKPAPAPAPEMNISTSGIGIWPAPKDDGVGTDEQHGTATLQGENCTPANNSMTCRFDSNGNISVDIHVSGNLAADDRARQLVAVFEVKPVGVNDIAVAQDNDGAKWHSGAPTSAGDATNYISFSLPGN